MILKDSIANACLCSFGLGLDCIKAKRIDGLWETGRTDFS